MEVKVLDKKESGKDVSKHPDSIDSSRRRLLGSLGKAAWVAPTLILLSSRKATAANDQPPPPPGSPLGFNAGTHSNRRPERKGGRD